MSDREDNHDFAYLDRVNDNLAQSLRRCHALVDDCRDKLAANSNDTEPADESEHDDERVG